MRKINENIYSLRKQQNMSLEELGKKIGTSRQTIQRYESGEIKNIPYNKICSLADALGVSPAHLMGFEDVASPVPEYIPEIQILTDLLPQLTQTQRDTLVQTAKVFAESNHAE